MKITVYLILALAAACHAMPQNPATYDAQNSEVQAEDSQKAKRGLPIFHTPIAPLPLSIYHAPILAPAPLIAPRFIAAHTPIFHAPIIHHPPIIALHH
ncbi:uncharacterized protein LOC126291916 [Schistocerca gregaria]|uniref:uncharacterized protein LOC126291916 n=1 Tax=Schistocerca gregaria TaxID=7010 RepID=UPI00211EAE99|nr:uncharacterized protein LOC126291916 [Schistocerca gregaria]